MYRNKQWLIGAALLFGGYIGWALGHQAGCQKGYDVIKDSPGVMSYVPVNNDAQRRDQWLALCSPSLGPLHRIVRKPDPTNLFRLNQNIPPSAA